MGSGRQSLSLPGAVMQIASQAISQAKAQARVLVVSKTDIASLKCNNFCLVHVPTAARPSMAPAAHGGIDGQRCGEDGADAAQDTASVRLVGPLVGCTA
eukprot:365501-Chlamydomonas_euryale.AAC.4